MPQTEQETRYNVSVLDANGETTERKNIVESAYEKLKKEAEAKGETVQVDRTKTFIITEASSIEEAAQLFPQRALEFLNYGARLAQHNLKQDLMEDADWSEANTDGAFDLLPHIQEPKVRAKASPRDKAINLLAKLARDAGQPVDKAQIEAMLAQFMPQTDGGQAAQQAAPTQVRA